MTQLGGTLRRMGAGASSVEEVAQRVVRLLYDGLLDPGTGAKACVLAQFYFTTKYSSLDEDLSVELAAERKILEGGADAFVRNPPDMPKLYEVICHG
jgi:hypothetical protein